MANIVLLVSFNWTSFRQNFEKYVAKHIYHFHLCWFLVANMNVRKALADVSNVQGNSATNIGRDSTKMK